MQPLQTLVYKKRKGKHISLKNFQPFPQIPVSDKLLKNTTAAELLIPHAHLQNRFLCQVLYEEICRC